MNTTLGSTPLAALAEPANKSLASAVGKGFGALGLKRAAMSVLAIAGMALATPDAHAEKSAVREALGVAEKGFAVKRAVDTVKSGKSSDIQRGIKRLDSTLSGIEAEAEREKKRAEARERAAKAEAEREQKRAEARERAAKAEAEREQKRAEARERAAKAEAERGGIPPTPTAQATIANKQKAVAMEVGDRIEGVGRSEESRSFAD